MNERLRIVHVTPHLGGGVGKAHASICAISDDKIDRTYILLEPAVDRRYADAIMLAGSNVVEAPGSDELIALLTTADVVQIEFWNHPRMAEFLVRGDLPDMNTVFWCHISGLYPPLVPPKLAEFADRFVFTSSCSLLAPGVEEASKELQAKLLVLNSGFGLGRPAEEYLSRRRACYLGTVDFVKMHPAFFEIVDRVSGDCEVEVWGHFKPDDNVGSAAASMQNPARIRFAGLTNDPATALARASVFFYPLQPEHYGTAENALIEAMSAGLAPIVMNNPAEAAIIIHGETGLIANSPEECTTFLEELLNDPAKARRLGENAAMYVAQHNQPLSIASSFHNLYRELLRVPKSRPHFETVLGKTPLDWFRSFWPDGLTGPRSGRSKGGLSHFLSCFPNDPGLQRLAADLRDGQKK